MKRLDDSLRAVPLVLPQCPRCGSLEQRTYGTKGRVRYHRCLKCETGFRSIQMTHAEAKAFEVVGSQRDASPPN